MIYLKNNNTIYPLIEELKMISDTIYHLCIGNKKIIGSQNVEDIEFYFKEIQKQIEEGKTLINLNDVISYKKKDE